MRAEIRGLDSHRNFEFSPTSGILNVASGLEAPKKIGTRDPQLAIPCVLVERPGNHAGIGIGLYLPKSKFLHRQMYYFCSGPVIFQGHLPITRA